MTCFVSLSWWVLHPSATLASALSHTAHHTDKMHAGTQALTHTNCIQKITSLPCRCLKITSVPHHSTNHSPGLLFFFLLFPSLSPFLTTLGLSLHFTSALNCQAWIALWTAWGGQAGRRCVWMRESLCYHHLFSFSSPSGAVRSQTRYHSPPAPPTGSHNTTSRKWNKRIKTKVNKMVAFQTPAPLPYPTNPMTLFVL